jgi:hypothetical protein
MSFSDVEMPGSSNSDSEPDIPGQVCVVPDVAAAYKRGPEKVSFCQTGGTRTAFRPLGRDELKGSAGLAPGGKQGRACLYRCLFPLQLDKQAIQHLLSLTASKGKQYGKPTRTTSAPLQGLP